MFVCVFVWGGGGRDSHISMRMHVRVLVVSTTLPDRVVFTIHGITLPVLPMLCSVANSHGNKSCATRICGGSTLHRKHIHTC